MVLVVIALCSNCSIDQFGIQMISGARNESHLKGISIVDFILFSLNSSLLSLEANPLESFC